MLKHGLLVAVLLVAGTGTWAYEGERSAENGRWLCWAYSGKGEWTIEIGRGEPLEYFLEQLPEFDAEVKWRVLRDPDWESLRGEAVQIGDFGGTQVVDITYTHDNSPEVLGKMVLVGKHDGYRAVVWILNDSSIVFYPTTIVQVAEHQVLVSRSRVPGTGNHYIEEYFVLTEQDRIPVNLKARAAINAALTAILPDGHAVWKGGGFDLLSLRYAMPVWKTGDANCCPSGGQVELALEIRDLRLEVTRAEFHPESAGGSG